MRKHLRLIACLAALALAGCASLEPRPELPAAAAVPAGERDASRRPDRRRRSSGIPASRDSGWSARGRRRSRSARHPRRLAGRSLDVQTYIWHADLTGGFLAQELLAAADRGVRVRLLVDDMDARAKNYGFAALRRAPQHRGADVQSVRVAQRHR